MKLKIALVTAVMGLVLSVQACVKPTVSTSTSQPPVANTPETSLGELFIASTNAFTDAFGTYHVVGNVDNTSSTVFNSIELTIEIKDASGNSLLKDDNGNITPNTVFYPMLYNLAPGVTSPFEFSYDTTNGTPASYYVTISGQQTSNANPATLQWENVQLMDDGSGLYYLTGMLINKGSQWAHIKGLAGGVLDDSNKLLSANLASTFAIELAPTGDMNGYDRTPFEINFPNPGGSTKWQLFWDADVTESVTEFPMEINITNTYFDQDGSARIVGWITNNSTQTLDASQLVAGLYAANGTVLDAGNSIVPLPVKPGAAAPFSFSEFGIVNHKPDQAALVQSCSVQFDPYFTSLTSHISVDLFATEESVQKIGTTWIIDGSVYNGSDKSLSGITVVAMVMDAQNKLVAMDYTTIYPTGDAIAAGDTNIYSIPVYLNPVADAAGFTTTTVIVGDVK